MLVKEKQCLDKLVADIFGFNAVQIGMPQLNALAASRMSSTYLSNEVLVSSGGAFNSIAISHCFSKLPFASESLDLIILPHVLEFSDQSDKILSEATRVLRPEGQIIICGFNTFSLWGMTKLIQNVFGLRCLPNNLKFSHLTRLKKSLSQLSFEINRGQFLLYTPPCNSAVWLRRFAFMENAGNRWWPAGGAVYIVQAIKRVKGMHLLDPIWDNASVKVTNRIPVVNKIRSK